MTDQTHLNVGSCNTIICLFFPHLAFLKSDLTKELIVSRFGSFHLIKCKSVLIIILKLSTNWDFCIEGWQTEQSNCQKLIALTGNQNRPRANKSLQLGRTTPSTF